MKKFSIEKSDDLYYSKTTMGSFAGNDSGMHNLRDLKIIFIKMRKNTIIIEALALDGNKKYCYIRALKDSGMEKIKSIFAKRDTLINISYKSLLVYEFVE